MEDSNLRFDLLLPPEIAAKAEKTGVHKGLMPWQQTLLLAILAGAFIALGAIFCTTITTGGRALPYGVTKSLGGFAFSLGLILVVIAGAELFTGNNLIVMAWCSRQISLMQVLRNWGLVYVGNFLGALATAVIMFYGQQYTFSGGVVGMNALNIANAKCQLGFVQSIALGMMCNALVCLAVWLCYAAHTVTGKIIAIIFPITAFVAAGFEHCVANMYFIPMGLLIKHGAASAFWAQIGVDVSAYNSLNLNNFLFANLLPVTLGNIVGGSVMVGMVYWVIYVSGSKRDV